MTVSENENKTLFNYIKIAGKSFVATFLGIICAFGAAKYGFDKYLESQEKRLMQTNEIVKEYKTDTNRQLDIISSSLKDIKSEISKLSTSSIEHENTLNRLLAENEIQSIILSEARLPEIQREFLPILSRTPSEAPIGGPSLGMQAAGFQEMVTTIPYPRSEAERQTAIERLVKQHRTSAQRSKIPKFDSKIHDFAISTREVSLVDGSIMLEITSTVAFISEE